MSNKPYIDRNSPYSMQSSAIQAQVVMMQHRANDKMYNLVKRLTASPKDRAEALQILSVQREQHPELAPCLWYSPATITALLSEVISIYPYLATNNLNIPLSNRVCNVLALFQCVAGHDETRQPFVRANIPIYLFPFLHQNSNSREAEYFKLTSLGIIGSLVKTEQPDIVDYLLQADFVPLCLRILKFSQEISRTVAAFIIQKILSDQGGRDFIVKNKERVATVLKVLNRVVGDLSKEFSPRLSKHVTGSYNILLDVPEIQKTIASLLTDDIIKSPIATTVDDTFNNLIYRLRSLSSMPDHPPPQSFQIQMQPHHNPNPPQQLRIQIPQNRQPIQRGSAKINITYNKK